MVSNSLLNILKARNRKSGNLKIRVPVFGNHFFVLNCGSVSTGILVKVLLHLRCGAAFTNIPVEIMHAHAQK